MSFTISINEEAAFEVLFAGPAGPTGPQGIQGIQGVPGQGVAAGGTTGQVLKKLSSTNYDTGWSSDISGVAWGGITGTLSSQTDLQSALNGKLSTSAASSTYLPLSGGFITGDIQSNNNSAYRSYDGSTKTTVLNSNYLQLNTSGGGGGSLTVESSGITFPSGKQTVHYPGLSILDGYATETYVNSQGFITASALSPYLLSSTAASTYAPLARGLPASGTAGQVLTKVNGSDYNASWTTIIPGDRYLTTSTTSNSVSNGAKTFTVGTGLSYSPTQDLTIAHDAGHHMHGTVTSYNSGTGVLVVDINSHTGSGTYTAWTVNVGGISPVASIAWGDITGTLGSQSDLSSALNDKLDSTTAASTYYLQTNPAGYVDAGYVASQGFLTDAPSDDQTYGRKNGSWVVAGGGSPFTGGDIPGPITMHGATIDSEMSSDFFGVELSSDPTQYAELEYNKLTVAGGGASSTINAGEFNFIGNNAQFVSEGNDIAYISNTNSGTLAVIGVYDDAQGGTFEAVKGSQRTILNGNGITFPDATTQSSAAFVPGSGDLNLQGYSITDGNFSSPAGQVSAQNVTMSSGGVLTFGDATVQTTAYTGGGGGGVPEAPEDGYVYGRAIGLWYRIPGINPFTAFAYSITSVGSWSVSGCNIYLTSAGTVYADTPGSATDITLTGGDMAGSSIDLNAFTNSPTISCNSLSSLPNLPNYYNTFYASSNNWSSLPNFSNNNGSLTVINNTFTSSPTLSVYPGASNLTSVLIDSNSGAFNITGNSFNGCPYLTIFICTNNSGAYCGSSYDSFFRYCTSLTSINFSNCPSFGFNSGDNAFLIDGSGCPVTYVDCSGCAFSDPQNSILSRLASNGLYGGYVNVSGGTNGGIDPGDSYLGTLQANGWTVIFNSL